MAYVRLADKLKQLNNADFKLMDAKDIEMDDGTDLQTTIDGLKASSGSIEVMTVSDWNTFFGGLTVDVSSSN